MPKPTVVLDIDLDSVVMAEPGEDFDASGGSPSLPVTVYVVQGDELATVLHYPADWMGTGTWRNLTVRMSK